MLVALMAALDFSKYRRRVRVGLHDQGEPKCARRIPFPSRRRLLSCCFCLVYAVSVPFDGSGTRILAQSMNRARCRDIVYSVSGDQTSRVSWMEEFGVWLGKFATAPSDQPGSKTYNQSLATRAANSCGFQLFPKRSGAPAALARARSKGILRFAEVNLCLLGARAWFCLLSPEPNCFLCRRWYQRVQFLPRLYETCRRFLCLCHLYYTCRTVEPRASNSSLNQKLPGCFGF